MLQTCRTPAGSVLGHMLLNIFIKNLEYEVNSDMTRFADVTKFFRVVTRVADCKQSQKDLTGVTVLNKR